MNIIITESQFKRLFEAANNTFSLEELTAIRSFKGKYQYCLQHCGRPQGRGSSRVIFQIDDDKILKLALNNKGLAQNANEGADDYYKDGLGIFPQVFEKDDENYTWIISEFVLPAKKEDFQQCFGISVSTFFRFITTLATWHRGRNNWGSAYPPLQREVMEVLLENEYLQNYEDFIGNYTDYSIGDMLTIKNYGMALRDGQPVIVLLDCGLTDDVWNQYYARR